MSKLDQNALSLYRQQQAAQFKPADTGQGFIGDVVDATQKGAYDGLAGIGETFGLDGVRDWAQEGANEQLATISNAGKTAMQEQFFVDKDNTITAGDAWTSPRAIAMQIGHVIGLNADILAGGAAIKGTSLAVTKVAKLARQKVLAEKGTAEMAEIAAKKATETFLTKNLGDKAGQFAAFGKDTLAYGAAGHAVAGGLQAIDVGNEVEALDYEDLEVSPEFQAIVRANAKAMPGAEAEDILATSRTQLAEQARSAIKTNPTLLTSNLLVGGLGSAALTRILSGAMPKGAGVAAEFGVEAAQGGMEQFAGNQVRQEYVDPTQDLNEGVTVAALNEGILGGAVGGLAAAVPAAVGAVQKRLPSKEQPAQSGAEPEQFSAPSDEMGPPAYPDLEQEFETPPLTSVIDPKVNTQSTFIEMASGAAAEHPEFVDGLVEIVKEDPERAVSAITVLDKYLGSASFRKNAMHRLQEYMGNAPQPAEGEKPWTPTPEEDASDFAILSGVVAKENPQFAEMLQQYVQRKPEKIGLAINTAGQWLINPEFRPKAEGQLAKFLASNPGEPVPSTEPGIVNAPQAAAPVAPDDEVMVAARGFIDSFPLEERGKIDPEILRDTFGINDEQVNMLMPWRQAAGNLSTDSVGGSVGSAEKVNEIKAVIDDAAAGAALSPLNDLPEPSAAQKEAGNYKKGHVNVQGLDIAIENPKGSERKGTDAKGKPWSVTMQDHYGYIKRTEGADGDHVDVFIGDSPDSDKVFVVDQMNKDGSFDEHKVVLGATDLKSAEQTYKRNYSAGWQIGPVKEMTMDQFKDWLKNGDTKKPVTQREQWESTVADFGALRIERYSDKSVVVRGDTKTHKDALKNLKGVFNPKLKGGEGWVYSKSRIDELKKAIPGILGRADQRVEQQKLSAAPEADKTGLFNSAKNQLEALAVRAKQHDSALSERITNVLPSAMPANFDAGRTQAEIQKYEKQVALNEKREAIKVTSQGDGVNQAGSKTPVAKTQTEQGKKTTPLFSNVEASNSRAAKLLQAKDDGFNIDKIWHRGSLFDASKYSDANDDSFFGKGFYLTSDPQEAEDYASTDVTRNMDYTVNAEKLAKAKGITYSEAKAELSKGEKTVAEFVVKAPALLTIGDKGLVFKGRSIGLGAIDIEGILGRSGVSDEEIERLRTQWERVANNDRKLLDNLVGKDGTQGQGYIELLSRRKALPAMREIALSLGADAILMKDGTAPTKQIRKGAEHLVILRPQAVMNISSKPFNDDPASHPKMTLGEARPRSENAESAESSEVSVKAPDYAADLAELKARASATDDWGLPGDILKLKKTLAELSAIEQAEKLDDMEQRIIWEEKSAGIKSPPHKQRIEKIMAQSSASGKSAESKGKPAAAKSPAKEPAASKLDSAAQNISDKKREAAEKLKALIASRKGQLNSGVDPEVLLAVAEVGALSIAEGAVKFAQWVRDVIATTRVVGIADEDVKPFLKEAYGAMAANPEKYGISDAVADDMDTAKDVRKMDISTLIEDVQTEALPAKSLANELQDKLDQIQDNRQLKSVVADYHGIPTSGVTPEMMKEAQEVLELALVRRAREIVAAGGTDKEIFDRLLEMYQRQPNLNVRSSTSMENMAYSTPAPLAFVAARLAGVTQETSVYEPTAGNGMLLISANLKHAKANELDPRRAGQLAQQGLDVTSEDAAEYIPAEKFDAAVMNPPFGRLDSPVKVDGYTIKSIDQLITIKALQALKDDGKATIIIGASKEAGEIGASDRVFFNYLYSNYNVVDHFEVDGDLYRRQGAGWPVRVIVVHGRESSKKLSPKSGAIERIETWNQVYDRFLESLGTSTDTSANASRATGADGAMPRISPNVERPARSETDRKIGQADQAGAGRTTAGGRNDSGGTRIAGNDDRAGSPAPAVGPAVDSIRKSEPVSQPGSVQPESSVTAGRETAVPAANTAEPAGRSKQPPADGGVDSGSSFQALYPALSKGFNDGALTPVNMAQASQRAMQKMVAEIGDVDQYVTKKLGYGSVAETHKAFMALQVDTVAAAIYNAENKNKGIIIADQTGVGKGRQAAGIIRYAIKEGKTPIFVTVTDNLFTDMYNDLADIGSTDAAPLIVNQDGFIKAGDAKIFKTQSRQAHLKTLDEIIKTGKLPADNNVLFLTYSQLDGDRQRRLINALKDNAIFVLDEAHNAAGIREKKSAGNVTLTRAGFIYEAIANSPVTYLSATYAKRPDNLPVFYRTDLMDSVDKVEDLVDAVSAGGEALQTLIAGMLAESGQLYRRERSFEGIKIDTLVDYENEAAHEQLADQVTEGLRAIVAADEAFHELAVDVLAQKYQDEGGSAKGAGNRAASGVDHSNFTSIVHNFISQLLIGLKVRATIDKAIELKKAGQKPVIALQNTMGAFLNGFVDENGLSVGDPVRADYRDVLLKALDRTRRISVTDETGDVRAIDVPLHELPADVQMLYLEAKEIIQDLNLSSIPLSPIDYVRDELEKAGIRTSEITGRGYRIDYQTEVPTLAVRSAEEQNDKRGTVDAFNDGRLDALILNVAGSTGLSIHAAEKFKDQSPRHMIVMQAMADINILMQMLGRINRTGQIELPSYSMLSLAIPAEKRPAARTSKKFKSLNAQTSANTDSDVNLKAQDMMNKYGDKVMSDYLREYPEVARDLSLGVPAEDVVYPGIYEKATGRMALLPVKQQKEIYAELENEYADLIEYLDKTGQNDLEPKTMDLDAKILDSKVIYEGKFPDTVFGGHTFLHKVDTKYQGKPPSADDVLKALAKIKDPDAVVAGILAAKERDRQFEKKLQGTLKRAQAELAKVETKTNSKDESKKNSKIMAAQADVTTAEEAMQRYRASVQATEDALKRFQIGHHFNIKLPEELVKGVVVAVKDSHRAGKGNPYSGSKVKFTFMVDSGIRQIDLSVSQLTSLQEGGVSATKTSVANEKLIHDTFKPVRKGEERRETRFVATGNAIMGSKKLSGRIISFTDHRGDVHQGILMPKNFKDDQFSRTDAGSDFALRDLTVLQKFLTSNRKLLKDLGVFDLSQSIRVLPVRSDEWKIEIPKANKTQAVKDIKFSEALQKAMGAEFFSVGNVMSAVFSEQKLAAVLPELNKLVQLRGLQSYRDAWVQAGGNAIPSAAVGFDGHQVTSAAIDAPAHLGNVVRDDTGMVPSRGQVSPGITLQKARMFAKAFDARLADSGSGTFIAEKFSDFPEDIQAFASPDAHGFLFQGKVYINLQHIRDLPSLQELLVHERLRHYGVRKLFGKGVFDELNKIAMQLGESKLKQLAAKYQMDLEGYKKYYQDLNHPNIQAALVDELIAHIKESDVPVGVWASIRRLLAKLKQALHELGLGDLVTKLTKTNEHDLFLILSQAKEVLQKAGSQPVRNDLDFDAPAMLPRTGNAIADAVSQINAERMQRWVEAFKPAKLWQAVKTKWPDRARPAMLQLLPRNYLADIAGDLLPSLRRYNAQVAAMEAQRNNLLNLTHGTADKWRKLVGKDKAASAKLADLMHEATLMGVDPSMSKFYPTITRQTYQMLMSRAKAFIKSRNGEAEAVARGMQRRARIQAAMDKVPMQEEAYAQLRADFLALPAEYQQMFIEVRDSYLEMNTQRKIALEKRIEDLIADKRVAAAQISMMREEFELNELNGIYFPLQRFGKYKAVAKDRETGELHAFSMFETNAQMQQWMEEQRGAGVVVEGGYQFEYSSMMSGVSAGFMKDLLLKFSPVFSQNSKIQDDLYQLFLEHSPDLSVRKHMIHRKGVSGYDQDALRAFAHNQFHTAYQIAKVSNTHHMQSHLLAMEDEVRTITNADDKVRATQVVNELTQRNEWILNPKGSEWANKLTGFGFFWYLGTTPAAALVNITQTAMVGLPVLGARYTYKEAGKMLAEMSKAFIKGKGNVDKTLNGRELSAFRELEESGIIDKTMAHDMTGIADGGVAYSPRYHKVMQVAGFMFHHAERFNREVTAMASYKLAYNKLSKLYAGEQYGDSKAHREAIAEAIELTKLSHFDYANSNRPRFMQGDMARVLLLFRQHSVNMTYRLIRDFQQSFWGRGEDKKIAQKQLAGMLGMTLFFAGAAGLPLYSVIAGIFNTMLDDEDEPFDFDAAVREALAEAIGETGASVIMSGLPGNVTGADLTNRIGMNNLWFRDAEADLEGEAAVQYYAEQALGPMYGILAGWGKATQLAREGHTGRAWESAVPKFARDWFKSVRYATDGVQTKRGDPILDELSVWQIALQANGFTPIEVSEQYGQNNALATSARRIQDRRKLLLNRYALARRNDDDLLVAQTLDDIEAFNLAQPTMKITAAHRIKSLKQRAALSDRAVNGVILSKKLQHLAE
jgi:hypothetical protein